MACVEKYPDFFKNIVCDTKSQKNKIQEKKNCHVKLK